MKSVMPEGFEEQMDISAMTDLLEFLTQRGKYLPLDIRKLATLSSASPMFYGAAAETMEFEKWGQKEFQGIPFNVLDPAAGRVANTMMLYGPEGRIPPTLPKQVSMEVGSTATVIHMLGGVGGWSAQRPSRDGRPVMTVRLTYEDQQTEEHILRDGVHFSDYIGDFAAAESQKAFTLKRGYQIRYLQIKPKRPDVKIKSIDFIKADHPSSPITMAITLEN
jgi:hypothetical protein